MDWAELAKMGTVVALVMAGIGWIITVRVDIAFSKLRIHIAEGRAQDKEELQRWINGSFLRSEVANARLDGLSTRVEAIEHRHPR